MTYLHVPLQAGRFIKRVIHQMFVLEMGWRLVHKVLLLQVLRGRLGHHLGQVEVGLELGHLVPLLIVLLLRQLRGWFVVVLAFLLLHLDDESWF